MGRYRIFLLLCLCLLNGCMEHVPPQSSRFSAQEPPPITADIMPQQDPAPEPVFQPSFTVQSPPPDSVLERIQGKSLPDGAPLHGENLAYLSLSYIGYDGAPRQGEILVHAKLGQEVADIFRELYEAEFPVAGMALIEEYDCDDGASMSANNTYAFCTRSIAGTDRYSLHSYGIAIDINPVQNPYVRAGLIEPGGADTYMDRSNIRTGMIVPGDACFTAFTSRGWTWGGYWEEPADYQHFEKRSVLW